MNARRTGCKSFILGFVNKVSSILLFDNIQLCLGGFAKVKLAVHKATGEKVAVKIMCKDSLGVSVEHSTFQQFKLPRKI